MNAEFKRYGAKSSEGQEKNRCDKVDKERLDKLRIRK